MATNVRLTPELERFTRECVGSGRYNNVSEVVRASLRLLQEAKERRRDFRRMLQEVEDEADNQGDISLETALATRSSPPLSNEACHPFPGGQSGSRGSNTMERKGQP